MKNTLAKISQNLFCIAKHFSLFIKKHAFLEVYGGTTPPPFNGRVSYECKFSYYRAPIAETFA